MEDVKKGLRIIQKMLEPYKYEVTVLGDREFGSIELIEYINKMGWTYYIRIKGGTNVHIEGEEVIGKLKEINHQEKMKKIHSI